MCIGLLYADDGVVGSQDPEWLQGALNGLIGLLRRYGLVENVAKSKAMASHPGTLRYGMLEEGLVRRCTGRGGNVPWASAKADFLHRLQSRTYYGLDDGTETADA